jgi:hypothetical protein
MRSVGFLEQLGGDLDAAFDRLAAERQRRRQVRYRLAAAAAAVVIIAAGLVLVDPGKPAAAGVSVEHRNGEVIVQLTDIEYRPRVIEGAAAAAGLDVDVTDVPTGSSLVGKFVRYKHGANLSDLQRINLDGVAFTGFVLPEGWKGKLALDVGRPAKRNEVYGVFTNAASEGEALACTGILSSRVEAALALVADRSLIVRWQAADGSGQRELQAAELGSSPWRSYVVAEATALDRTHVVILLAAAGSERANPALTRPAVC